MDEKPPISSQARRRRYRWVAIFFMSSLLFYMLFSGRAVSAYAGRYLPASSSSSSSQKPYTISQSEVSHPPVPLEIHIMSKCPDAQYCLSELVVPSMVRTSDKVNFTLSYIGTPTENDGIECKHGPEECMGNIIELCAVNLYPDVKVYLGFTNCLTQDYPEIPDSELVEECALEFGIDKEKLNECASRDTGAFGLSLLRQSIKRSAEG
ncbi:hypothetical protein SLS62_004826 [Diatrype stigma]|uniref:Gamma interferon inducible lysosomal thiol reductase GILT n=1 Tax=Diatrype stigma TaxID=117547 RepID=A0AAN9UU83_9PEZI